VVVVGIVVAVARKEACQTPPPVLAERAYRTREGRSAAAAAAGLPWVVTDKSAAAAVAAAAVVVDGVAGLLEE
jgi:hypothetical protein